MREGTEELEDEDLRVLRRQRLGCLQDLLQIRIEELEYKVQIFKRCTVHWLVFSVWWQDLHRKRKGKERKETEEHTCECELST